MPPLNILICGGGIAGPSLAFWLARLGHSVTIVERSPSLRASGAQIDLRAQGIKVVIKMGLMDTIRRHLVAEDGRAFLNNRNQIIGRVMANKSGKGAQSITSEYEIMRGDLVRILYDATKGDVKYVFGKTVDRFEQNEESLTAYFSDGEQGEFDILVGADGQGSRIRKAILPPNEDPLRRIGLYIAFWNTSNYEPYTPAEPNLGKMLHAPGRWFMARGDSNERNQAGFFIRDDERSPEFQRIVKAPAPEQTAFWAERIRGTGWVAEDRFIEGMKNGESFYSAEVAQVHTNTWHKGRVVLLADAASCPSPMTGMGTTGAFVGAYVLAGEIARHADGDVREAFPAYDRRMRPFVEEIQKINPAFLKLAMPKTWWGVYLLDAITMVVCWLRIPELVSRFSAEDKGGWILPEYEELEVKKMQ